jgi:hypothetical protein
VVKIYRWNSPSKFEQAATIHRIEYFICQFGPTRVKKKKRKRVHILRDRIFKLIEIYRKAGHNIVMKNMIWSGFSTEIYEWVWFSKILNI